MPSQSYHNIELKNKAIRDRTRTTKHLILILVYTQPLRSPMTRMPLHKKISDHIPLQHHSHTNPTNIKVTQSLKSFGHSGYFGYYGAQHEWG